MTDNEDTSVVEQWFYKHIDDAEEFKLKLCLYGGMVAVGFVLGVIYTASAIQEQATIEYGINTVEYHLSHSQLESIAQTRMRIGMVVFVPLFLYALWIDVRGGDGE